MRFLIIGGGSIGRRHISNLKLLNYTDLFCLRRAPDPVFEKEYSVKVITNIRELRAIDINAVFVCTPTSMHTKGMEIAAKLNAALFMEKPLIHNLRGLHKCKRLAAKLNKVFFIGFMLRFHPLVQKIKEIIDSKELGPVYSARFEFGSYLPYWHPMEDHRISYASTKELGGGVINTITHELDLIQYYFGEPNSVQCSKATFGKLSIEMEEIAEACFRYNDKLVTLHLDYLQKDYDRNIKILCDEGKIVWNWHENHVKVKRHNCEESIHALTNFDVNQLYIDELKDFIGLIKSSDYSPKHSLDFEHAQANTNLMLLMHKSAEQKRSKTLQTVI